MLGSSPIGQGAAAMTASATLMLEELRASLSATTSLLAGLGSAVFAVGNTQVGPLFREIDDLRYVRRGQTRDGGVSATAASPRGRGLRDGGVSATAGLTGSSDPTGLSPQVYERCGATRGTPTGKDSVQDVGTSSPQHSRTSSLPCARPPYFPALQGHMHRVRQPVGAS
jgi:hypothetical protein